MLYHRSPSAAHRKHLKKWLQHDLGQFIGSDYIQNSPKVNIIETDESFLIELAAPGLQKEDFHLRLEEKNLHIKVEKETEGDQPVYNRREFNFNKFERRFGLPKTVNTEGISANYVNGILSVVLPKIDEAIAKPARDIEVG
ncbi:MAG: Hsp20/alpha crystallin family protein [Bacteroidota bacterium]